MGGERGVSLGLNDSYFFDIILFLVGREVSFIQSMRFFISVYHMNIPLGNLSHLGSITVKLISH